MAENDNPRNGMILVAVVLTILFVVAIVVGVDQYYRFAVQEQLQAKVFSRESPQLRDLRANERFRLENYSWVDKSTGQVTIPLERARELVLKEWAGRPGGFVPGTAAAAAAPAPAPTEGAPAGGAPAQGTAPKK